MVIIPPMLDTNLQPWFFKNSKQNIIGKTFSYYILLTILEMRFTSSVFSEKFYYHEISLPRFPFTDLIKSE